MTEVKRKVVLAATPKEVWALIGDFNALPKWVPPIADSVIETKDGKTYRHLTLGDGAKLTELLEGRDDSKMMYKYTITSGPLPIDDYHSKLKVEAEGKGSKVKWKSHFKPRNVSEEEVIKIVSGVYEAGLGTLKKKFG